MNGGQSSTTVQRSYKQKNFGSTIQPTKIGTINDSRVLLQVVM